MWNKLKSMFRNNDSYRIVVLDESQFKESIEDPRQSQELAEIGFEITGGRYKGVVARLRSIMERPVPNKPENDTGLYVIFDYVVIQIPKKAKYSLEDINDESTGIGLGFTDIARPMFENFLQHVITYSSKVENDK